MILHMMNKAKAPCGTDGSDAVKVFPFSDFDFAEPFGSAFFLPSVKATLTPYVTLERSDRVQGCLTQEFNN
jgi:hypothetical protein